MSNDQSGSKSAKQNEDTLAATNVVNSGESQDQIYVASAGEALDQTAGPKNINKDLDSTVVGENSEADEVAVPKETQQVAKPVFAASTSAATAAKKKTKSVQLGDFKVLKKLGQGGMGEVYLATQVSLDRKVALKTLSKELARKEDFVKRFLREAKSMAKIHHPNAVQVYAADSVQGVHFVAIEFIDGQSMQDWMDDLKQLNVGDALHVILRCANALQHAHELNLIHRDIKPDNILVTKKGVVKVADFGLAKAMDEDVSMTQSGTGLGTPLYMPPEQARNAKHVDHRTDIYALGSTLYYFLTGKLPFTGENTLELIMAKEKGQFTPAKKINPAVPERLDLMIDKMIMKDPQYRYADCDELMQDLESLGLENNVLSFIDGASAAASRSSGTRSRVNSSSASTSRTQIPSRELTSAADADKTQEMQLDKSTMWHIQYFDDTGKPQLKKMTTAQVLQRFKSGVLDLKAKGKRKAHDKYVPLAQFDEFREVTEKLAIREKAASRGKSMQETYAKLEQQDRWRKRLRPLYNLLEGVKGLISLIIWLAIVGAVGFAAWNYGWPYLQQIMQNSGA